MRESGLARMTLEGLRRFLSRQAGLKSRRYDSRIYCGSQVLSRRRVQGRISHEMAAKVGAS